MRKIARAIKILCGILGGLLLTGIILIFVGISITETIWDFREKAYYSDQNNFITEEAVVDWINYTEEGEIFVSFTKINQAYSDVDFVIRNENAQILYENDIENMLQIGTVVTYTSAPGYFGDGYCMPIVALSIEGEELLNFEDGYANLMEEY